MANEFFLNFLFFFTIPFIIIVIGTFIIYFRRKINKLAQILETQAIKRNGEVIKGFLMSYPKLVFNYNTYDVILYILPGGRYSPPRTYFKIKCDRAITKKMFIYKEGVASKIGKAFGMQDIQIGTDFFDKEVIIKGSDEYFIRSILTIDVQDKILHIVNKLKAHISVAGNLLEISFPNITYDEVLLDELINLGLILVDKIKDKGFI